MSFVKFFRNTFIMENLRTGFERTISQKMANQHSCYNRYKQLFEKTSIARESVYLRTVDRMLILNLIVIFISFTDMSFLKYVT